MALVLFSATVLVALAGTLLLLRSRHEGGSALAAILQRVAGSFLFAMIAVGFIIWGWAGTATDNSQFARALLWGDPDPADVDRFPTRTVRAGGAPSAFALDYQSAIIERFDADGTGEPFRDFLAGADTSSFIVTRGDAIVYEEYFGEATRETVHTSLGIAKPILATLIGIAVDDDQIDGLADPITAYLPELAVRDPRFSKISIGNLLTGSSGLSFDDGWGPFSDLADTYYATDLRDAGLTETTIEQPPGLVFEDNDWNVTLLGLALEQVTRVTLSEYLQVRLWQPMGAEADATWSLDSVDSGFERPFAGINARAIDFARFGRLYLRDGRIGDVQIVSAGFVDEATHADTSRDPAANHQYLWWVDVENGGYYAEGDHCQYLYVHPPTELVFTRLGEGCGDTDWLRAFGELTQWLPANLLTGS